MPLSIVLTVTIVTVLYIIAALALTGMQPYEDISEVSGFPVAFYSRGWEWAAQISAFGEVFTLPIVVIISLMAQPRLQYALAKDGLLPEIFARVDDNGNIWHGTAISGIIIIFWWINSSISIQRECGYADRILFQNTMYAINDSMFGYIRKSKR